MKILHRYDQIQKDLFHLGMKINKKVGSNSKYRDAVCLPVLQGVTSFFTDISRNFTWDPIVDYVGASSYDGQNRQMINAYKMPKPNLIQGKAVFIFDDILDSGNTMDFFVKTCFSLGATSVTPVVLLKRKDTPYVADPRADEALVMYEIADEWVWGYGMDDTHGRGRTLKHIVYDEPGSQA